MDLNTSGGEKVLVTGGTGFLGAALVHELVREGVPPTDIRVFYLEGTSTRNLGDLPGVELFPGNILDEFQVRKAFGGVRYAFHVVGNTSFDPFKKRRQWLVNVEGTRNVLEAAKDSPGLEKAVYTSTVNVLGPPDPPGSLGNENTSPYAAKNRVHNFETPGEILEFADAIHEGRAPKKWWKRVGIGYLNSKLAAQELVELYARDHGVPVCSVLPGTNFGPYDEFVGSGTYIVRIYNNALPGYTPGGGFPCTHVLDQARGHFLAMTRGRVGERYVVTGRDEDNLEMGEMFRVIAEVLREKEPGRRIKTPERKIPVRVAKFGALFSEVYAKLFRKPCLLSRDALDAGSYLSFYTHAKASEELGYQPERTFRQAVADHFDFLKARGLLGVKSRGID
ncbi:MAG: NAD-dependent epimerase/dehydratase family protein [Promethearchaeota archaeon]